MNFSSDRVRQKPDWWHIRDIRERLRYTAGEPEYKAWWQDIREYAELAAAEPLPALTFEAFREFADTGSREQYERIYFERRGRIGALALMVLLGMSDMDADHPRQRLDKKSPNADCIDRDPVHEERSDTTYEVDTAGTAAESADVYMHALEEALWDLCGEYTWCLSAHLPAVPIYPVWEEIDLFAAETAGMLAELVVLLDGKVDERIIQRMRVEVQRRILKPAGDRSRTFGWETAHHNWSAVCAAGCGIAALLLLDREQRAVVIERMKRASEHFLAGYGEDGGCAEGLGYWVYGFGYYTYWMDMLSKAEPDGKYPLDESKIAAIAAFPERVHLSEGRFVNFSDSGEQDILPPGLLSRLAEMTGQSYSMPFVLPILRQDPCRRWGHLLRNILWSEPRYFGLFGAEGVREDSGYVDTVSEAAEIAADPMSAASAGQQADRQQGKLFNHYWQDLCWLVSRAEQEIRQEQETKILSKAAQLSGSQEPKSSAERRDLQWTGSRSNNTAAFGLQTEYTFTAAFAAKGGHNDEPHNHNDLGSFILHAGGENILCDPGAGMYTQSYFAEGREHILNISSAGHSVPQINGYEQCSGLEAAASIQYIHTDDHEAQFRLDLTAAYPAEAGLMAMYRHFYWYRSGAETKLRLQDSFQFAQAAHTAANETSDRTAQGTVPPAEAEPTYNNHVIERLISHVQPAIYAEEVIWTGKRAQVRLQIPREQYHAEVERIPHHDHDGQPMVLYRTLLRVRSESMDNLPEQRLECSLKFTISPLV